MGEYLLSLPYYKSNSWLHAAHFACSAPTWPIMKIRPTVWHFGQCPVVTFFGPLLIIFWVFRRPITQGVLESSIKFKHQTLKWIRIALVRGIIPLKAPNLNPNQTNNSARKTTITMTGMSLRIFVLIWTAFSFMSRSTYRIWITMDRRLFKNRAYAIIMILSNSVR